MQPTTRTFLVRILAALATITGLTACGLSNFPTITQEPASRPVTGATRQGLYYQQDDSDPTEPYLDVQLHSTADLDQLPPDLSAETRSQIVGLVEQAAGKRVIVVVDYGDCFTASRLVYGETPGTVKVETYQTSTEETTCYWMPQVVEAWSVPVEAFTS